MLLCEALRRYQFPPVTFDFEREQPHEVEGRPHEAMRRVEQRVGQLMCSPDPGAVRDGLSNVLYGGGRKRRGCNAPG